ncbi:MAG: hypothetical protein PHW56_05860 [Methanosarcinaceae archaeon]|nr:hypothetical protein [Methanosarcinaceae archaeon]
MVQIGPGDKRTKIVFLASLATSFVLINLFLLGALFTNMTRGTQVYTLVDMAAGVVFVFVISMIIAMSLWPKVMDKLEAKERKKEKLTEESGKSNL